MSQVAEFRSVKDQEESKKKCTELIKMVYNHMREAALEASKDSESQMSKPKTHKSKRKNYWDDDLELLHNKQKALLKQYRISNFKCQKTREELKQAKTQFRWRQRKNIDLIQKKQFNKINVLYSSNKNQYWKEMNRNTRQKIETTVPISELKDSYFKLFNEKIVQEGTIEKKEESEKTINNKDSRIGDRISISAMSIKKILKGLPNNKSNGYADVSNEMFKYASCDTLVNILKYIFDSMLNNKYCPTLFNVGVIKPLVKD